MRPYQFAMPHEPAPEPTRRWVSSVQTRFAPVENALAVVVAVCGALNLLSVMGGPSPTEMPTWIKALFPLDFSGMGRSATMLLGFAMVLVSIHLWRRKSRALGLAVALSLLSGLFHLTKGWDLEEAACSVALAGVLVSLRERFPVLSGKPRLGDAAVRAAVGFVIALLYGVAGFWLLEPHEFGRNFHWLEALSRSLQALLFYNDPALVPRTSYAFWFLDSLDLMALATFTYAGFALFHPVSYLFRENAREREIARRITVRYGRSGQDFFKLWGDKSLFFSQSGESYIAYRVSKGIALALGDPVGPVEEQPGLINEFASFCRLRGWVVGFHQVHEQCAAAFRKAGFRLMRIGEDAIVDLERFSLQGSEMKEFRNTVNRLDKRGYTVECVEAPLPPALLDELQRVSDEWLALPGHRERQFTLGLFRREYVRMTPVHVARDEEGRVAAFLNLIPSYQEGLATVDLMRRRSEIVNGTMDYLFAKAFLDLKCRGYRKFSLGMAPLVEYREGDKPTSEERLIHWLSKRAPILFRADSLRRFKSKYAHRWETRYLAYQSRRHLPSLALALRRLSELPRTGTSPMASMPGKEVA